MPSMLPAGEAVRDVSAHDLPALRPRARAAVRICGAAAVPGCRGRRQSAGGHRGRATADPAGEADPVLILEHDGGEIPAALRDDCRVVTYDHFMDTFVDLDRHLAGVAAMYPCLDTGPDPVAGSLLSADARSGQMRITEAGAAAALLEQVAAGGGNLLIVGRPGSGKTTLLKHLVTAAPGAGARRYRFFFDLAVKGRAETFPGFVTRTLGPCMAVEAAYVFPALCYFARAGSVLCALDGVDEAVPQLTQSGFLDLFAELSQVLSAESAVVMTSRVSFLEDSSQVRRLPDCTPLMSEKPVPPVDAQGVAPPAAA